MVARIGRCGIRAGSDRACARAKLLDKRLHAMKIAEIEDRVAFTDAQLARAAQEKDALEAERRLSAAAARWDRVAAYGPSRAARIKSSTQLQRERTAPESSA